MASHDALTRATHWICPDCREEVSVKANQCAGCGGWRPRHGELINNGQAPDDLLVYSPCGAQSPSSPGLDRDEQMGEEPQASPPPAAAATPQPPPPMPMPEPKSVYLAKKGLGKGKGMGAPPEGPLPHTSATLKSYSLFATLHMDPLQRRPGP
ncbi:unnamed protein product [Symbiodinium sp. CCMP2592]|nr:unnamed protein product [Symbiodinium sp. CCMP2592]